MTSAEEVTNDSECVRSGSHSLENKSYLSRMGKYWLCKSCSSEITYSEPVPQIDMRSQLIDGKTIFLPIHQEDGENQDLNVVDVLPQDPKDIFIEPCLRLGFAIECQFNFVVYAMKRLQCLGGCGGRG